MKVKALGTVGVVVGQGDDAGLTMEMRHVSTYTTGVLGSLPLENVSGVWPFGK